MIDCIRLVISKWDANVSGPGWLDRESIDLNRWAVVVTTKLSAVRGGSAPIETQWYCFTEKSTGMRITGPVEWGPTDIEVSLPRLLWGENGRLIRTQAELNEATDQIDEKLSWISPKTTFVILKLSHVELTWHFAGSPVAWVPFYALMKHPRIESLPHAWRAEYIPADFCINPAPASILRHLAQAVSFTPTSVTWSGERVKIKLYDKVAQMGLSQKLAPVMRLEFTLFDTLAKGLLTHDGHLDFERCYQRYREFASGFRDFKCARSAYSSPLDLLLSWRSRGLGPEHEFQTLLSTQSRATRGRYMKRARGLKEVWETVPGIISRLPEDGPPDAPDVVPLDNKQQTYENDNDR
jgi:hypothetical protein